MEDNTAKGKVENKTKGIIVTGDISLDKNIYKGERLYPEDKEYGTDINNQKGGAYIIYDLLSNFLGAYCSLIQNYDCRKNDGYPQDSRHKE